MDHKSWLCWVVALGGAVGCAAFNMNPAEQAGRGGPLYQECASSCVVLCESTYYTRTELYAQHPLINSCPGDDIDAERCEQCIDDCRALAE